MPGDQQKGVVPDMVKKEIRSVLLSKIGGVPLQQFSSDFTKLVGHRLEWKSFGFQSVTQLLEAIPDVARFVFWTFQKIVRDYMQASYSGSLLLQDVPAMNIFI